LEKAFVNRLSCGQPLFLFLMDENLLQNVHLHAFWYFGSSETKQMTLFIRLSTSLAQSSPLFSPLQKLIV